MSHANAIQTFVAKGENATAPTLCEGIPGTNFIRRREGERKLPPIYIPELGQTAERALVIARAQAEQHGIKRFVFKGVVRETVPEVSWTQ